MNFSDRFSRLPWGKFFQRLLCGRPQLLQNRILQSLGRPQTNHGLGLDLDGFASLRIAAHARLAVRLHNAADSWNDELARGTLGFFHRKLVQLFKKERCLLLRCAELFGDVRNDLGLAEWLSCHLVCLSSCRFLSVPGNPGGPQNFFVSPWKWAKKVEPRGLQRTRQDNASEIRRNMQGVCTL